MGTKAADFIERVASARIQDARKKVKGLIWGKGTMYELAWEDAPPEACALGIAELAVCSNPEAVANYGAITEMRGPSRLGKREARAKVSIECTLNLDCREVAIETAEDAVIHINDRHAKSWDDCRRLLHQFARLERKAVEKKSPKKA